jgi:hypothetical protein
MTKLNITADPNFVAPKAAYDLIPRGDYLVEVVSVTARATKAGDGLSVELRVVDGPYRNRRVWVQMNLEHPDATVRSRAYAELQALCKAVGVVGEIDTESLCGIPLTALIYATEPKAGYGSKNSARQFRSADWLYPQE